MWDGDVWVAIRAARMGADEVRAGFDTVLTTTMKGQVDPVTQVDLAAEQAIRAVITSHFPTDAILGEEEGGGPWDRGRVWIIDPLDGTINFVHGIPQFSVSVALWADGEPLVGVVIDVPRDEEFVAVKGEGTRLNERHVSVSSTSTLDEAVLVTGFPYDRRQYARPYLEVVATVLESAQGIRRLGSAALDIAWVACGRFDGYWEYGIHPWDGAAGVLLVTEAGGQVSDHLGKENQLDAPAFIATNGEIHSELVRIVADGLPEHLS